MMWIIVAVWHSCMRNLFHIPPRLAIFQLILFCLFLIPLSNMPCYGLVAKTKTLVIERRNKTELNAFQFHSIKSVIQAFHILVES